MGQRPARRKCRPRHARMLGAATRGTKQQPHWGFGCGAAHRRPVSGCGSQRMLHALERRSHSTDHGPSFASLFPPLAAVSSAAIPVRVKLKIPRANATAVTTVDVPSRWDPNTKKEPTGLFFAACGWPCSFDSSYGLHEKIPDPKIRDFIHDPYGNRTHVTAVKGPCLNRLTNGP